MVVKFNKFIVVMALVVLVLILPACGRDNQENEAADTEKAGQPQEVVTSVGGKVLEVVGSGSFIFISLDRDGQQIWATVPAVDIKVGEKVTLLNANIVKNFRSKSMNRSFDEFIFSTGIEGKSSGRRVASISRKKAGRVAKKVADSPALTK